MVLKARPTTYNGIKMRSRTEAKVAAELDAMGLEWEYEPQAFASSEGQYLPDFRLRTIGPLTVYLEVKGAPLNATERRAVMSRMEIIWASEPDAFLLVTFDPQLLPFCFLASQTFKHWPYPQWGPGYIGLAKAASPDLKAVGFHKWDSSDFSSFALVPGGLMKMILMSGLTNVAIPGEV